MTGWRLLLLVGWGPALFPPAALVAAAHQPASDEERRLWNRSVEEEQVLTRSGFLVNDPELDAYLTSVVNRLIDGEGFPPGTFPVHAVKDSTLNAFAFPHGPIYIHSGLLARFHNEAQLAAVLGHEVTHPINHHTWREVRDLKSKTAWLAGTSAVTGGMAALPGVLATMASVSGYSRALETEADNIGFERMVRAGYDTAEAHVAFLLLLEDLKRVQRKEPFFFGSHPKLAEREENYRRLHAARKTNGDGDLGEDRFVHHTLGVLLLNGELEMRAGRFDAARDQLARYHAEQPGDPQGLWLLGETERLDAAKGSAAEARARFEQVIATHDRFAPARRSLGLLLYRAGEWAPAARQLRRFLELEPEAQDRAYLETYIQKCDSAAALSPSP